MVSVDIHVDQLNFDRLHVEVIKYQNKDELVN